MNILGILRLSILIKSKMFFKGNNTTSGSKDGSNGVDKQTEDLPLVTINNNDV
jgi:hypothetical protein